MQIITELDPEDPNYGTFQRIDQIHQEIREGHIVALYIGTDLISRIHNSINWSIVD